MCQDFVASDFTVSSSFSPASNSIGVDSSGGLVLISIAFVSVEIDLLFPFKFCSLLVHVIASFSGPREDDAFGSSDFPLFPFRKSNDGAIGVVSTLLSSITVLVSAAVRGRSCLSSVF